MSISLTVNPGQYINYVPGFDEFTVLTWNHTILLCLLASHLARNNCLVRRSSRVKPKLPKALRRAIHGKGTQLYFTDLGFGVYAVLRFQKLSLGLSYDRPGGEFNFGFAFKVRTYLTSSMCYVNRESHCLVSCFVTWLRICRITMIIVTHWWCHFFNLTPPNESADYTLTRYVRRIITTKVISNYQFPCFFAVLQSHISRWNESGKKALSTYLMWIARAEARSNSTTYVQKPVADF